MSPSSNKCCVWVCVCSHPSTPKHIAFKHSPAYELSVTVMFDCHFLESRGMYFNWIECIHSLLTVKFIGTNTHALPTHRQYFYVCERCFLTKATLRITSAHYCYSFNDSFYVNVGYTLLCFIPWCVCVCVCTNECVLSRPSGFHCGFKGMSPLSPHTAMLYKV